jgi:hypothetical protein
MPNFLISSSLEKRLYARAVAREGGCALLRGAGRRRFSLASLPSLQGRGGGRIPTGAGISYAVSRTELTRIIESMPTPACRAMHVAQRRGDTHTAQRLLREAAESYFATAATPRALSR